MNAKKTLKKYIGLSALPKIIAWILTLATIGCVAMAVQQKSIKDDLTTAVAFDPYTAESGDLVYLDLVGVSNWLYKIESDSSSTVYYSAEDAEDNWYTVILGEGEYNKMLTQRTYWNRFGENDPNAEVYRIYGTAKKTSSEVKQALTDSWSDNGITTVALYERVFGTTHIDATSMPSDGRGDGYILGAIFAGIFAIVTMIANSSVNKATKKSLKRIQALGETEKAAAELDNPVTVIGKNKCTVSENYVFSKGTGVLVPIKDILWMYKRVISQRRNYRTVVTQTNLVANTCQGKAVNLLSVSRTDPNGLTDELMAAIVKINPTILLGHDADTRKEYKALLKEYKTTGKRPADNIVSAPAAVEAAETVEAVAETAPVAEAAAATAVVAAVAAEEAAPTAEAVTETVEVAAEEATEAVAETAEAAEAVAEEATETVAETAEAVEAVAEEATEAVEETAEAAEAVAEEATEAVEETAEAAEAAEAVTEEVAEAAEAVAEATDADA